MHSLSSSNSYPEEHSQKNDPIVLIQFSLVAQLGVCLTHSFISTMYDVYSNNTCRDNS